MFRGDLDDLVDYCWIVVCDSSTDRGNNWRRKFSSLVTLALVLRSVNMGLISKAILCTLCAYYVVKLLQSSCRPILKTVVNTCKNTLRYRNWLFTRVFSRSWVYRYKAVFYEYHSYNRQTAYLCIQSDSPPFFFIC